MAATPPFIARTALSALVTALIAGLFMACPEASFAQGFATTTGESHAAPGAKMLVDADELINNTDNDTVTAVGTVKLYYNGSVLEADRVTWDKKTGRVFANGRVKVTDDKDNVFHGSSFELTDDFKNGFINSLRLDTPDHTHMIAAQARRYNGEISVYDKAVYTACDSCAANPGKPPLWQIRAQRIVHDQKEHMIYYEDAHLEFAGVPIAYVPYMSQPDPTVKRKTGFLNPTLITDSDRGYGAEIPYFWNIAPNMDVTLRPQILSNQGVLGDVEFRHRLSNGTYTVRAAGIIQANPDEFSRTNADGRDPADLKERGAIHTTGDVAINSYWKWGWDLTLMSDRWFMRDYDLWSRGSEAISTVYLTGQGDRSFLELRGYHFYGMSNDDRQDELPVTGVLDFDKIYDKPVYGGELSFNMNATTLYRDESDFQPGHKGNALKESGDPVDGDDFHDRNLTCADFTQDCTMMGMGGTYTRTSIDTQWKRQIVDGLGQVWTPFAFARGDVIWQNPDNTAGNAAFLDTDDQAYLRGMAGVGLEYRLPLYAATSWGTHVVQPIAQVIVRPNEGHIGDLPNEDAQSLMFDDTNLFAWDKFSGYDRIEGGTRANLGLQYTFNMNSGSYIDAMFGQSYQLFGKNSFAQGDDDVVNTGDDSGLEHDRSDYVSRLYWFVNPNLALTTRFRFDRNTFSPRMVEVESRFKKDRLSGSILYGRYEEQPRFGFDDDLEGVVGNLRYQLTDSLYVIGATRYNIGENEFDRASVGVGYIDECLAFGLTYDVDWSHNDSNDTDHKLLLKLALRTLGEVGTSFNLSGN